MLRILGILVVLGVLAASVASAYGVVVYTVNVDLSSISEFIHRDVNWTWEYIAIEWSGLNIPNSSGSLIFKLYNDPVLYDNAHTVLVVAFYSNDNGGIYIGSPAASDSPTRRGFWNSNSTVTIKSSGNELVVEIDGEEVYRAPYSASDVKAYGIVPYGLNGASGSVSIRFYQEINLSDTITPVLGIIIGVIPAIIVLAVVKNVFKGLKL